MKKIILTIALFIGCISIVIAQMKDPAHWAYGVKKISDNIYQVHLKATIDDGWHIYAQKQSPDAVAVPTKITFTKLPGLTLIGKPAEIGKKDTYTIKEAGVTNYEYAGTVDFVQQVSLQPGIKQLTGTITYQTCTHKECLQAQTINFSIPIQ